LLCHKAKVPIPEDFVSRFQQMLDYIWHTQKPDGTHPMIGDGDQLLTEEREHWEARALIPVYLRLMGISSNDIEVEMEPADWFIGPQEWQPMLPQNIHGKKESKVYEQAGHVVLRNGDGQYLFFNCGPFGYDPHPHHGHADALSVEICLNGRTIIMDPGGYAYKNDRFRTFARGTSAHSTVTIDDKDQSDIYGIFTVGKTARVILSGFSLNDKIDIVEAKHTGYEPIIHIRRIYSFKKGDDTFIVYDRIEGKGRKENKLLYHLAPEVHYQKNSSGGYDLFVEDHWTGHMCFLSSNNSHLRIVRGSETNELSSFVSRKANFVEFSTLFELKTSTELPMEFITVFSALQDCRAEVYWDQSTLILMSSEKSIVVPLDKRVE
jgi:hypothetical protein